MTQKIAFQGEPGAYSHQACQQARPDLQAIAYRTFEDAIEAVRLGKSQLAMLPVENSIYGRVADIHHLLPQSGLHIVDEVFLRVCINLLALPGSQLAEIRTAMSHAVLLGQCRTFLGKHDIQRRVGPDTAGSARRVAELAKPELAALASDLAGEIYGLECLATNIEDHPNNTTRFLIMGPTANHERRGASQMITTFVFQVRNIPAALYKAMGGFATNGVNMTKLESYMVDGNFAATQFYADIEGHPDDAPVRRALEELGYFTTMLRILGVYPSDAQRYSGGAPSRKNTD